MVGGVARDAGDLEHEAGDTDHLSVRDDMLGRVGGDAPTGPGDAVREVLGLAGRRPDLGARRLLERRDASMWSTSVCVTRIATTVPTRPSRRGAGSPPGSTTTDLRGVLAVRTT